MAVVAVVKHIENMVLALVVMNRDNGVRPGPGSFEALRDPVRTMGNQGQTPINMVAKIGGAEFTQTRPILAQTRQPAKHRHRRGPAVDQPLPSRHHRGITVMIDRTIDLTDPAFNVGHADARIKGIPRPQG
jgi:hypothetical protein